MERSKLCLIRPFLPFISHNGILPCVFDINIVICWGFLLLYQREIFVYGCNSTDFGWSFSLLNSIYDYCGRMRDPIMIETSLAQQMYINFLKSTSTGWLCCRYWLIYNQVTQHAWTTTSTNELQRTKVNKGSVSGPWPPLGRNNIIRHQLPAWMLCSQPDWEWSIQLRPWVEFPQCTPWPFHRTPHCSIAQSRLSQLHSSEAPIAVGKLNEDWEVVGVGAHVHMKGDGLVRELTWSPVTKVDSKYQSA